MEITPIISIIIPSYNHEKFLNRCIDSVLNQSYNNFELIVIDDGSKDSSNDIIASYNDSRLIHLQQENKGAHNTINRGLSLAKGDYLTILNSDDEFLPNRLEKCMNVFEFNAEVDFISTWIDVVDVDNKLLGVKMAWENMEPWEIKNKNLSFYGDNYTLNALMANFVATTSNMIFKRKVYEELGGMRNLRFAHDWDFLLRVCAEFNCYNLKESHLVYRIHGTNTISSNRKWMLFEICWIIAANIDKFSHLIINSIDEQSLSNASIKLLESFNFQGNDHVFWLLYWEISNMKKMKIIAPEEIYLENKELRDKIIEYVKE
jgi:glycosyltransferase involved in cell wall biosynthesis